MSKFQYFKVGTVFNKPSVKLPAVSLKYREVIIKFPSRLNAMALDPSKIAINKNMIFKPGEIVFSIQLYKKILVRSLAEKGIIDISPNTKRKTLVKHSVMIMKKALGIKDGLHIEVSNEEEIRHVGLGSSSSLIAGVAAAINELYGCRVPADVLVRYLAQNHGEEIDNNERLIQQVQCIGGSAASGMYKGGLLVIVGESRVIKTMEISPNYSVVIGIPKDFKELDAATLMRKEEAKISKFVATGERFSSIIAYRMLHEVLPAMEEKNLKIIGDLIYDYRFNMGSIKNCSFTYRGLISIANKLKKIKAKNWAEVLALSSVGPAFFTITKKPDLCKDYFEAYGLKVLTARIENDKYRVIQKISI